MADTSVIVLPAKSAHHAQRSPRRKAVTVMATVTSPNATLYMPYVRYSRIMYLAVSGDALTSAGHEPPENPSNAAGRIALPPGPSRPSGDAAAPAPHSTNPTSTTRTRIQAMCLRVI